ncbi:MAG: hypothetical protein HON90_13195 [Halobacteriovoraceae bacterium]|jgi:ankyrin repeat protein|nr:hypothetical protein [Halobacteriovoraceae bacterium]
MLGFIIIYGITTVLNYILNPLVIITSASFVSIYVLRLDLGKPLYTISLYAIFALMMSIYEYYFKAFRVPYLEGNLSVLLSDFPKEINFKDIGFYFLTYLPSVLLLFLLLYIASKFMVSQINSLSFNLITAFICVFAYSLKSFVIIPHFSVNGGPRQTTQKLFPTHEAAKSGNIEELNESIAKGHDLNQLTNKQLAPIHFSIQENHYSATKLLLESGAQANLIGESFKPKTPLIMAVVQENLKMVELLLAHGADLHLKPCENRNVLFYALGNIKLFDLFITKGVDFSSIDIYGESLLTSAASLTAKVGLRPHPKAQSIVLYLLDKGMSPDGLKGESSTPVLHAISKANIDVLNLLISRGANPNKIDSRGHTALINAILINELAIVDLLLKNAANVDLKGRKEAYDNEKYSPLEVARLKLENNWDPESNAKTQKIIELLLASGAK